MPDPKPGDEQLRLELYKALLEESRAHREKVSAVWLQKFALLGAMIAFLVAQYKVVDLTSGLFAVCILAIPAIAVLLDIKVCEFGLQANLIDRFISENYEDPEIVPRWERTKWDIHLALVRLRSLSTVLVTALPTCLIALMAGIVIRRFNKPSTVVLGIGDVPWAAWAFCPIYLLATWYSAGLMFRKFPHTIEQKESKV
jgi:hypothetical protein